MQLAKIGSIGNDLRDAEDLLGVFADALAQLADVNPTYDQFLNHLDLYKRSANLVLVGQAHWSEAQEEAATELLSELEEALNDYAPDYTSFGAAPGDPANFGFWVSWDSLESDAFGRGAAVLKVAAGDEWPSMDDDTDYVLEVNDHGNAALFGAHSREEIWSCV